MLRSSIRLNGLTSVSITKLDVLTGLEKLKISVAYQLQGKKIESMPASLKQFAQCTPVYEELPGWKEDISAARQMDQLPTETRNYLSRIEEITEVLLSVVSVGPMREETIVLKDPF